MVKIAPVLSSKLPKKADPSEAKGLTLLATSLSQQTKVFFENSTLHGVRYIAEENRPFCEKFMWFSFTSVGAVATCIIIVSLWEKFQTNPTITGLDTDFHNWDVPFPAITICKENPVNEALLEEFLENSWGSLPPENSAALVRWLASLSYKSIVENASTFAADTALVDSLAFMDTKRVVLSTVEHCDSIFYDCEWKDESEECCEVLYPVFTEMGFCYAFNSKHVESEWPWQQDPLDPFQEKYIHETDAKWSFLFNSMLNHSTMAIYIHSSEEMAGLEMSPQHIWDKRVDKVSFSVKATYTTADARQLSIKQRRCVFPDEIALETSDIYTYTACMRQCRMRLSRSYCGCVPHFYPVIEGYSVCGVAQLACVARHAAAVTDAARCRCELGCHHDVYELEKLTEADASKLEDQGNYLEAEFVSWPMVRYKREVLFGWVDLLVSFGGIAGLFLGFSLLSGVEVVYYFTVRAWCAAVRDAPALREQRAARLARPKPPHDLSLVPWWRRPPKSSRPVPIRVSIRSRGSEPPQYSPPPVYPTFLP